MKKELQARSATLHAAKALFAPIHKSPLGIGNSANTVCDVFTAGGFLVINADTGDFKAPADGELWPPVPIKTKVLKCLAKIYWRSGDPLAFERRADGLKVGPTLLKP